MAKKQQLSPFASKPTTEAEKVDDGASLQNVSHEDVWKANRESANKTVGSKLPPTGVPPSIGRIVRYIMDEQNAKATNLRRMAQSSKHHGSSSLVGDHCAMMITAVAKDGMVSGQVFLDGNDSIWVRHAEIGEEPGNWYWPPRA